MPLMPCAPAVPWREVESMERRTIGEITVYTVASEESADPSTYNFVDLEAALSFAETADFVGGGAVALELADGTHYLRRNPKQPGVAGNEVAAYNFQHMYLFFSGSGRDACRIAFDPGITVEPGTLFRTGNAKISFYSLTLDLANDDNAGVHFIRAHHTYLYLNNTEVIGADRTKFSIGIWFDGDVFVYSVSSKLSGFKYAALFSTGASSGQLPEIQDCNYGVVDYFGLSSVLSSNNNADTPVHPMRFGEIGAKGGIVSDGSVTPPTLAGWTGATADRPTLPDRAYATPYLDTDLGYPIWWVGDKWVDATGTEV